MKLFISVRYILSVIYIILLYAPIAAQEPTSPTLTSEALAEDLPEYRFSTDMNRLEAQIQQELNQLATPIESISDKKTQQDVQAWLSHVAKRYQTHFNEMNHKREFVNIWGLNTRIEEFLKTEEAKKALGKSLDAFTSVFANIDKLTQSVGNKHFQEESLNLLEIDATSYAQENPMKLSPNGTGNNVNPLFSVIDTGKSYLKSAGDLVMLPARTATGISDTGTGISEFNETARKFTETVDNLPTKTRKEIEALIANLEANQTALSSLIADTIKLLQNLDSTIVNANQLSANVDNSVQQVTSSLDSMQQTADALTETARESQALVASIQELLEAGRGDGAQGKPFDINEYTSAARAIDEGAQEVSRLMLHIKDLTRPATGTADMSGEESRPFDIREYTAAANAIEQGAAQIQAALNDVQSMLESQDTREGISFIRNEADQSLEKAGEQSAHLIDRIFYRLAILLVIAFVLALVLIIVNASLRLKRPKHDPNPR